MLYLLIFFILPYLGFTCQPPIPASYQREAPPSIAPASPVYASGYQPPQQQPYLQPNNDQLVAGVAYANSPALQAPSRDNGIMEQGITPYPGYIPPPPPPPAPAPASGAALHSQTQREAVQYPKLIDSNLDHSPSKGQVSINELEDMIEQEARDAETVQSSLYCPPQMTQLDDFLACVVQTTRPVVDETVTNCSFDGEQGCRFTAPTSSVSVGHFNSEQNYMAFAHLAKRQPQFRPRNGFLYFVEYKGTNPEEEMALSTTINCQRGNGVLKLDYWIIGDERSVEMRVCTQDTKARSCTQAIAYNSNSTVSVEVVHPNATIFDLEIVSSNLIKPTAVIIDNIEYQAELCEINHKSQPEESEETQEAAKAFFEDTPRKEENSDSIDIETEDTAPNTIPGRPNDRDEHMQPNEEDYNIDASSNIRMTQPHRLDKIRKINKESACSLLDCDFSGSFCGWKHYVTSNDSMILADWKLGNQHVGNPHTGIREEENDGGFLYVGTDSSHNKIIYYILESSRFTLNEDIRLSLDVYRRSNDITLQICLDTPFYCPYAVSPFEKDVYWKEGEAFVIPKDTTTIYLKAIQWRRFKWLAIDNIRVMDKHIC